VMTAGRTVVFSATLIAVSAASLFLLPQGFVKSLTYAVIISVSLAAVLSITLLPACLAILGKHVDALGVRTLFRVPFLANWTPSRVYLNWLADRLQKTKTREEVEAGFWGKLVNVVMRRPLLFAIPIIIGMIALILPLHNLSFGGGISETYLPPDNPVRLAQQNFDKIFPGYRTNQLTLVIESDNHSKVTDQQVAEIRNDAASVSGFTDTTWQERNCPSIDTKSCVSGPNGSHPKDDSVRVIQNGLAHASDAAKKLAELRSMTPPRGLTVLVGGVPALEQDSIHSLSDKAPLMAVVLLSTTMLLMFLAFGSVVLPIKAAVMSALTLGSTLGILTWIFVDGHFANLLNFTPAPLMIVIIALVVAVGFGLATDYEVFLVSRMVEARARGMSTAEAIRIGTATTGRLITAAALVLAVVAGSFAFSDLMMMQCLAFGLMAALLLDATVVRMFLVPSVMKLLGDDCWWAPLWMKRLQNRLGLGEIHLPDERKPPSPRPRSSRPAATSRPPVTPAPRPPHDPTHPSADGAPRPSRPATPPARPDLRPPVKEAPPSAAGTKRMPAPGRPEPKDTATTRFSAQPNPPAGRPPAPPQAPPPGRGDDREIESWLSDLRGGKTGDPRAAGPVPPQQPSADETRALQIPREPSSGQPPAEPEDKTTAIPTPPRDNKDPEVATEKMNARGENDRPRPRRGGGLSAQDLLRREGRI
jgi:trehalose monomycolate/heme transporter